MLYYVNLTDREFNVLQKFLMDTHEDEVYDILCDTTCGDYFWDYEEEMAIPFTVALEDYVSANIGTEGLVFDEMDSESRHVIEDIFEKHCRNTETKNYVKKINKILDKQSKM